MKKTPTAAELTAARVRMRARLGQVVLPTSGPTPAIPMGHAEDRALALAVEYRAYQEKLHTSPLMYHATITRQYESKMIALGAIPTRYTTELARRKGLT